MICTHFGDVLLQIVNALSVSNSFKEADVKGDSDFVSRGAIRHAFTHYKNEPNTRSAGNQPSGRTDLEQPTGHDDEMAVHEGADTAPGSGAFLARRYGVSRPVYLGGR